MKVNKLLKRQVFRKLLMFSQGFTCQFKTSLTKIWTTSLNRSEIDSFAEVSNRDIVLFLGQKCSMFLLWFICQTRTTTFIKDIYKYNICYIVHLIWRKFQHYADKYIMYSDMNSYMITTNNFRICAWWKCLGKYY